MIQVTMSFTSVKEAAEFFAPHAAHVMPAAVPASTLVEVAKQPAVLPEPDAGPAEAEKKTRAPRKPKDAPADGPKDVIEGKPAVHTIDDVRAALQGYVGRTDYQAGTALVHSFGASRLTEIPAERYAEFIEKAGE